MQNEQKALLDLTTDVARLAVKQARRRLVIAVVLGAALAASVALNVWLLCS